MCLASGDGGDLAYAGGDLARPYLNPRTLSLFIDSYSLFNYSYRITGHPYLIITQDLVS